MKQYEEKRRIISEKIVVIESAVSAENIDKYVRPYVTETPSSGEHCVCKRAG